MSEFVRAALIEAEIPMRIEAVKINAPGCEDDARALLEIARHFMKLGEPIPPDLAAYMSGCIDAILNNPTRAERSLNLKKPKSRPTNHARDREIAEHYSLLRAAGWPAVAAQQELANWYEIRLDKDGGSSAIRKILARFKIQFSVPTGKKGKK